VYAVRPQAIARCAIPADVAEAIAFAQRHELPVATRSGGHCFAGRSSTHGLLIDVRPMKQVHDARCWLERSWGTLRAWGTGGAYPNFPDPELEDAGRTYHGANRERLTAIKAAYDPAGFFPAT
jgi:FAD/FMN-containing dehydrogenase